ncbi:MAG: bacillithiol biosynthesis cysteine-adding enzyme BshC [Bacteroidia bacterium]
MKKETIPYPDTSIIRDIILDYLRDDPFLRPYHSFKPELTGAAQAIAERPPHPVDRQALAQVLKEQYKDLLPEHPDVEKQIQLLQNDSTFTVTTGHQLNIFTGFLFFIYKIISTINYSKKLKHAFPEQDFVPVYWMATEDHDFEEISEVNLFGKNWRWELDAKGKVGSLSPSTLKPLLDKLEPEMQEPLGQELMQLFQKAYLEHETLAAAHRYLVQNLFKGHGLVILDADDNKLKSVLIPVMKADMFSDVNEQLINKTKEELAKKYKLPVNPREINFFYLQKDLRERIVEHEGIWKVLHADVSWTQETLEKEIEKYPERFSPNVAMRPIYQEMVLPNLAYIGGTNEIAYWFELKRVFDHHKVFFPQLMLRNSVLTVRKRVLKKIIKLNLAPRDFFMHRDQLVRKHVKQAAQTEVLEREVLEAAALFTSARDRSARLDADVHSFIVKHTTEYIKGMDHFLEKLNRHLKKLNEKEVAEIDLIYSEFYPNGTFQERQANFITFYLQYGQEWFDALFENLDPLAQDVVILEE